MDYRGASKDGTYGSKNRNQSHWLKAAWPEKRESTWPADCWRAELPGSSMSICLPLPPPFSFLLFLNSLSSLLHVSLSPSFFPFLLLSRICSSPRRPAVRCCYLYPWPVHQTDTRESFHANSPENAFFVMRRGNALVPNSFPRQNRDASSDRSKATHPRVSSLL